MQQLCSSSALGSRLHRPHMSSITPCSSINVPKAAPQAAATGRQALLQPAAGSSTRQQQWQQQQQQQQQQSMHPRRHVAACALKDEQAEIDRIAREADQTDIWGSEFVGTLVKVGIVAGLVGVVVLLANLAKPLADNTIRSFPTPEEYANYEQREGSEEL